MSGRMDSGPEQTLTADEDDPHIIVERCGCRCYVCGAIVSPDEGDMLVYPVHPDYPANIGFAICDDCFVAHTDEQLDEYLREMQEYQQALEQDRGDYEKNRECAFDRDDYTCQLCGHEGYPKTERGLVAYPVQAENYHLDNLVTICNECITDTLDSDEDDRTAADRLRCRAARAKEWLNSDEADAEQGENIEGHR
jgi:hypothetical protein